MKHKLLSNWKIPWKKVVELGHTCNLGTWEAEEELQKAWGQPELQSEFFAILSNSIRTYLK